MSAVTWLQRQRPTWPTDFYRYSRWAHPQAPCFLPSSSYHRQDSHHHQLWEEHPWHQSPGDPTGAKEQHESHVSLLQSNFALKFLPAGLFTAIHISPQNWLCWDSKAQKCWYWVEERRDRRWAEKHQSSSGVSCAHTPAWRTAHLSPSGLTSHWVL